MEETINGKIVLSMRAIYQNKVGLGIMDKGTSILTPTDPFLENNLYYNTWHFLYLVTN